MPTVRALLAGGHDVLATARTEQSRRVLQSAGAECIDVDIYDEAALQRAMRGRDAVIRMTTKLPKSLTGMRGKNAWNETNRLRAVSAGKIVDAAIAENVGVYITESFFAAYRPKGAAWVHEGDPSDDAGLGTMKAVLATEHHAQRFAAAGGRGIALRFGAFYGPDTPSTIEIVAMLHKRMIPVIGAGDYYFPSLYLNDAARAVVCALDAASGTYNVCDDDPLTWSAFVDAAAQAAGAPRPMRVPAFLGPLAMGYPWKWMSRSIRMSNDLLKKTSPWRPSYPDAAAGVRETVRAIERNDTCFLPAT